MDDETLLDEPDCVIISKTSLGDGEGIVYNETIVDSGDATDESFIGEELEGVTRCAENNSKLHSKDLGQLNTGKRKFRKSAPWWGPSGGENSEDFARLERLIDQDTIESELSRMLEAKLLVIRKACTIGSYFDDGCFREALSFIRGISHAWKRTLPLETRKELKSFAAEILVRHDCFSLFYRCLVDMPQSATRTQQSDLMVEEHWELYNFVWTICVNNTDRSPVFAVEFGKVSELLDLLKEHLLTNSRSHHDESINEQNERVVAACSKICHNIAQVAANRRRLRDMNFVEVLSPYLNSPWDDFRTRALLTLAYILDEKQSAKYLADRGQIRFLLSLLEDSVNSPGRRCEGWSTKELLRGVARLAINDANKKALMEEGVLPTLVTLLNSSDIEEQREASKTLFLLAFDKSNRKSIIGEANAIAELIRLKSHKDMTVKQNAHGALWVLRDELEESGYKKAIPRGRLSVDGPKEAKYVMISYQWKHQEILIKVKDQLTQRGFKVWMDIEQMHGSILQTMAEAVENAAVILVCLSQKYKDSPNCRAEAEYAFQLHKDIIPLKLEAGYRPDGWLGMLVGSRLYFDLTRQFEKSCENLVRQLSRTDPTLSPILEVTTPPAGMDYPEGLPTDTPPLSGDSSKEQNKMDYTSRYRAIVPSVYHISAPSDLQAWFDTHRIYSEQIRCLSAEEIVFLRQLLIQAPEYFYRFLEKRFHIDELRAVMKIVRALESLDVTETE